MSPSDYICFLLKTNVHIMQHEIAHRYTAVSILLTHNHQCMTSTETDCTSARLFREFLHQSDLKQCTHKALNTGFATLQKTDILQTLSGDN